jgi:hypothetical protein
MFEILSVIFEVEHDQKAQVSQDRQNQEIEMDPDHLYILGVKLGFLGSGWSAQVLFRGRVHVRVTEQSVSFAASQCGHIGVSCFLWSRLFGFVVAQFFQNLFCVSFETVALFEGLVF